MKRQIVTTMYNNNNISDDALTISFIACCYIIPGDAVSLLMRCYIVASDIILYLVCCYIMPSLVMLYCVWWCYIIPSDPSLGAIYEHLGYDIASLGTTC